MSSPRLTLGRHSEPGRIYSITTVTYRRRPLFLHHGMAAIVEDELRRLASSETIESIAWVVMPDHLHWLFELRQGTLAACMRLLKGRSAHEIIRIFGIHGAIWQPGYFDHALRSDESVRTHARYLLENPVRAKLTTEPMAYAFGWCRWDLNDV
jgi:putative transposase